VFLLFLFSFWIGNDDLHLKNLSMAQSEGGGLPRLSMAYDRGLHAALSASRTRMALPLNGRKLHINARIFMHSRPKCGLGGEEADRLVDALRARRRDAEANGLIARHCPRRFQLHYRRELE